MAPDDTAQHHAGTHCIVCLLCLLLLLLICVQVSENLDTKLATIEASELHHAARPATFSMHSGNWWAVVHQIVGWQQKVQPFHGYCCLDQRTTGMR
jgi:hypothetical protein